MKIAYLGFDLFFECLQYLADTNEIVKIFTCEVDGNYEKNELTYALAKEKNIPITPKRITASDIDSLEKAGCDLIISAGYYFKIPVSDNIKSINIHPSLLPEGRGPWPLPVIILKGINESGVTAHRIAENFDEGEIVLQKKISVCANENLETLTQKMKQCALMVVTELSQNIEFYWNTRTVQNGGSYWKEPSVKDMSFTLKCDFEYVDKITRAFYGYKSFLKNDEETKEIVYAVCVESKSDIPTLSKEVFELNKGYLCILK